MGTMTMMAALLCTHVAAGEMPSAGLHEHPTITAMLEANNQLRASVGLSAQRISPRLTLAAQAHARYMADTGYFDHYVNGTPQSRANEQGYSGSVLENIAMGYGTVDGAFNGWHYSPGHWASIISDTPEAGFGYAVSANGTGYWVGMYGYPAKHTAAKVVVDGEEDTVEEGIQTMYYNYGKRGRRNRGRRRR